MVKNILYILLITVSINLHAQEITEGYFRSPLDIPLYLSGNFGELRSNHFHAGLDIKTQGVEGKKVYAIADGYVSRIKVSPYGYGNALYITHPNGFTSVYGHLQKYSESITELVKEHQYKKEAFAVQLFPAPFKVPVKKGEVIAYSGNTGGSGGPHLHFEIRNTKTEHPYNPLFFGFDIKDAINPDIYAVTVYALNDTSSINGAYIPKKRYQAQGKNGVYHLISKSPILLNGEFGFGIETVDRMSGTGNKYGLHNIQLQVDEKTVFEQQIDEFAFHEGRYINSHIDYETYIKNRRRVQKSFIQEGNKLRIYKIAKRKGHVALNDSKTHQITYRVSDLNGNSSTLSFSVLSKKPSLKKAVVKEQKKVLKFLPRNQRNTIIKDEVLLDLPQGVLYEDLYFEYEKKEALSNTISPVYWLHNHFTPLHSYATVSIKKQGLTKKLKDKALIVSTTDGKGLYAEGGKWNDDNISVKTRSFGGYAIALDTIPPNITPINIYQNANMSRKWSISIKVTDNLSGLDYYRATVDGKWVLMEYDAKNDQLIHYFDEKVEKGKHTFQLIVKDGVGNSKEYKADFVR